MDRKKFSLFTESWHTVCWLNRTRTAGLCVRHCYRTRTDQTMTRSLLTSQPFRIYEVKPELDREPAPCKHRSRRWCCRRQCRGRWAARQPEGAYWAPRWSWNRRCRWSRSLPHRTTPGPPPSHHTTTTTIIIIINHHNLHYHSGSTECPVNRLCATDLYRTSIIQSGPKKCGHRLTTIILSNFNRLKKFTGRFLRKFVVKRILKIPPHLAYLVKH